METEGMPCRTKRADFFGKLYSQRQTVTRGLDLLELR
jgi:hypothetical protein